MSISASLLPEWHHETANTRKELERLGLKEVDLSWKPHEKSMTIGQLADHLADIPGWMSATLDHPELDFAKSGYKPRNSTTVEGILEAFDKSVAAATSCLAQTSDATMMENWSLRNGEKIYFTMPKVAVLRSFVISHMIHHRAQFGLYLRLLDIPVPSIYGPSADEGNM